MSPIRWSETIRKQRGPLEFSSSHFETTPETKKKNTVRVLGEEHLWNGTVPAVACSSTGGGGGFLLHQHQILISSSEPGGSDVTSIQKSRCIGGRWRHNPLLVSMAGNSWPLRVVSFHHQLLVKFNGLKTLSLSLIDPVPRSQNGSLTSPISHSPQSSPKHQMTHLHYDNKEYTNPLIP